VSENGGAEPDAFSEPAPDADGSESRATTSSGDELVDVVLTQAGEQPVAVMRELRRCLGYDLREARSSTRSAPIVVASGLDRMTAEALASALRRAGATVTLPPAGTWNEGANTARGVAWRHVTMREGTLGGWPCVVLRPARGGNAGHILRWGVLVLIIAGFAALLTSVFWLVFGGLVVSALSSAIVSLWGIRHEPWPSSYAMIVLWRLGGGERIGRDAHHLILRRRLLWGVRTTRIPLSRVAGLVVDPEGEDAWVHHWKTSDEVVMVPSVSVIDKSGEALGQFGYVVEPTAARELIETVEQTLGLAKRTGVKAKATGR